MNDFGGIDLDKRLAYLEEARFSTMQAIRLTRELKDFHASINQLSDPGAILEKSRFLGKRLINFEAMAFFLVNEETKDFDFFLSSPESARQTIAVELEFFIEDGTFSRAVLDKTPVSAFARDFKQQYLFHVLATASRVRGMFVGVLKKTLKQVPEASLELFSSLMSHCASALESFELYQQLQGKISMLSASQARLKNEMAAHRKTTVARLLAEKEKHKLESELWQARKMESIGLLAGGTAHDFNNLLSIIMNFNALSLKRIPEDHPVYAYLKKSETACHRAMDLARKLYTIGSEDHHKTDRIDAAAVVTETLRLLKASLGESVVIRNKIADSPLWIMAEETRIQQVLMNLITNAAHAMKSGTIEISGQKVLLSDTEQRDMGLRTPDCIRLSVKDSGPGIAPDIIPRVFDPYFSTKKGRGNAGLGLAVVHSIIKNYDGFIRVDSKEGRGTSFHIHLPAVQDGL